MSKDMNHIINQYINSQVNLNEIKQGKSENDLNDIQTVNTAELEANNEYERFKERLKDIVKTSGSYSDVKNLIQQNLKIHSGINYIRVGNACCTITLTPKVLTIILNSDKELISYCFNTYTKEEKEKSKINLS